MRRIIALDIHKHETQACVMDKKSGKVIEETRFPTTEKAFKKHLKKHGRGDAIIESVGFHRPVARWLDEQGHEVHLAHTGEIPKPRVKTDKKDAKHLANLFRADLLPEAYLPPEEIQRLRDIGRQRQFLGQESRRLKTKIMHDLFKHGHFVDKNPTETIAGRAWLRKLAIPELTSCLDLLEKVNEEKERFEKLIEAETTNHPDAQLLMTIPGVGAYTALLILAEVGDFRRFKHKDAVGSYAGLGVRQSQSGDEDKRGGITKEGNSLLRWILVEATRNHVGRCPESQLTKRYKRLAEKKGSKKATIATARVLVTVMYAMITKGESFQVNPLEARA